MKAPRVLLIDYGLGNLRSVEMALRHVGGDVVFANEPWGGDLRFSHIVLPGVGAFPEGAKRLRSLGLDESIIQSVRGGQANFGFVPRNATFV